MCRPALVNLHSNTEQQMCSAILFPCNDIANKELNIPDCFWNTPKSCLQTDIENMLDQTWSSSLFLITAVIELVLAKGKWCGLICNSFYTLIRHVDLWNEQKILGQHQVSSSIAPWLHNTWCFPCTLDSMILPGSTFCNPPSPSISSS